MDTRILGALRPALTALRRATAVGLITAVAVAGVALTTTSPASAAAPARTSTSTATSAYEKKVQTWVNKKRKARGLQRLRLATCTDNVAERWSSFLAKNDLFYHQDMASLLDRCNAIYVGETLGRGAVSPRRLVRMWMESDGHRHVLLSKESRRIGIGATRDAYGRWVVAANFMRF